MTHFRYTHENQAALVFDANSSRKKRVLCETHPTSFYCFMTQIGRGFSLPTSSARSKVAPQVLRMLIPLTVNKNINKASYRFIIRKYHKRIQGNYSTMPEYSWLFSMFCQINNSNIAPYSKENSCKGCWQNQLFFVHAIESFAGSSFSWLV